MIEQGVSFSALSAQLPAITSESCLPPPPLSFLVARFPVQLQDEWIEPTLGKAPIKTRIFKKQGTKYLREYATITGPMFRGDLPMDPSLPYEPNYPRVFSQYRKEEYFNFIPDVPEEGGAPVAVTPHPDEWA